MALKTERVLYTSRNMKTGITDIKATIRRGGVVVAGPTAGGGGSDNRPTLTQVSATEQPGKYELVLSPANITTYGGEGFFDFYIDSDTQADSAPAIAGKYISENNETDLENHLDTIETIALDVQTKVTANKATLEHASHGLAALKTLIDTVQSSVTSIQNNTRFTAALPDPIVKPKNGDPDKVFRVPLRLFDTSGNPEDPDSDTIYVKIKNQAGTSRSSYLTGYDSGNDRAAAVKDAAGIYHIDFTIEDTTTEEELLFEFLYSENSVAFNQGRAASVMNDVQAEGLALESTAQDILTDTADMQPRVADIQTKINSATYGLSALKDLIDIIDGNVDANKATLEHATYGLSAIKTILDTKASQASVTTLQTSVTNLQTDVTDNVKGTGFSNTTDSLKKISERIYTGGYAV